MDRECQTMTETRVLAARAKLTDRMAALERRVTGTVEEVADSVQGAASSVKSTVTTATNEVQRALGATADGVRGALDVPAHIRRRPWAGVGAAAVAGFLTGFIPNRSPRAATFSGDASFSNESKKTPSQPGVFDELWSVLKREAIALGQTAIASASEAAKQGVQSQVSRLSTLGAHNGTHAANGKC